MDLVGIEASETTNIYTTGKYWQSECFFFFQDDNSKRGNNCWLINNIIHLMYGPKGNS